MSENSTIEVARSDLTAVCEALIDCWAIPRDDRDSDECEHCNGHGRRVNFSHEPNCPVLIAQDIIPRQLIQLPVITPENDTQTRIKKAIQSL